MGTYAIGPGQGGMYGLIFDNTFSKTVSKTATFVLLTYPTDFPPHSTQHIQTVPGAASASSMGSLSRNQSPKLGASESVDSLQSHLAMGKTQSRGGSILDRTDSETGKALYHTGILQKHRRKKGQGYARRYFSLDFGSCTLSYYYSRNSSALRGAIPLSLAAITADSRRREISIDSGAEVWHLKAGNPKDFEEWTKALQQASSAAQQYVEPVDQQKTPIPERLRVRTTGFSAPSNPEEDREWEQVESLVSRIAGTRDAVRRLSKDTLPGSERRKSYAGLGLSALGLSTATPNITSPNTSTLEENGDYFGALPEKKSFWKRKASAPSTPQLFARSISSQLAVPTPSSAGLTSTTITANGTGSPSGRKSKEESSIHDHCAALLNDLDSVLFDFNILISTSKRRRQPGPKSAVADRASIDSTSTGEFYDAQDDPDHSQIILLDRGSEEETPQSEIDDELEGDTSSFSSADEEKPAPLVNGAVSLFPLKPKSLDPIPSVPVPKRRKVIPKAEIMPPSLIGFFRKNVGKDLSTISMPVSANEPVSLLQRIAEQFEYSNLLDTAAKHKQPTHRLLYVTAFAVSQFSSSRAKERAIRKPFNPMLGETYELVRSEKEVPGGFRVIVEKVSHRPVVMAVQADSSGWSFSQTPAPTQKFWGKSAELITDGRARTALRLPDGTDEHYSWNVATVFLRNVVMGEKYVEPVGTMTVTNETTGEKAIVEFKQKGMFGGRSEEVQIDAFRSDGVHAGIGLTGNWAQSLRILETGKGAGAEIWRVGDLVEGAAQRYGLTTFAATLNEITEIEKGKLPPTDCRLRPDQRAAENGDLDTAETWKAKLEENQRVRRKELEERNENHKPRWFVRVDAGEGGDGEEFWKLKSGKDGYWEERARGKWEGVEDILAG